MWLVNRDELNLNLPKFAHPLIFFSHQTLWHFRKEILLEVNIFAFQFATRCENLDRFQYGFQPIKFANSVVSSPCETQPYNN